MAKVLCINDFHLYSEMVALMLAKKGQHEVEIEIVPFQLHAIVDFDPDVLVLNLVRKMEALRSPLADFYSEVDGARAFRAVVQSPELRRYPLIITAIAVEERELPKDLPFLDFIEVPGRLDRLLEVIESVVAAKGEGLAPG